MYRIVDILFIYYADVWQKRIVRGVERWESLWQILKLVRNDNGNGLRVECHCILSSTEDRMVVGNIPNILRLINV